MWFYMIAVFLLFVGIIGGVASGGIFTLIFIPLGVIMLIVATVSWMWARAQPGSERRETRSAEEPAPLPHSSPQGSPAPHTPGELADARRARQ
jgi:hypothetical protein